MKGPVRSRGEESTREMSDLKRKFQSSVDVNLLIKVLIKLQTKETRLHPSTPGPDTDEDSTLRRGQYRTCMHN